MIRILEELVAVHGRAARRQWARFLSWCGEQRIEVRHIQPGKAGSERVHRGSAGKCSTPTCSTPSRTSRAVTDEWLEDYNSERPHDSLGRVPPRTFLPRPGQALESSYQL